jgi:hypothetical protein
VIVHAQPYHSLVDQSTLYAAYAETRNFAGQGLSMSRLRAIESASQRRLGAMRCECEDARTRRHSELSMAERALTVRFRRWRAADVPVGISWRY